MAEKMLMRAQKDLERIEQTEFDPMRVWSDGVFTTTELHPEKIHKDDPPSVRPAKLKRRQDKDDRYQAMGLKRIKG